MVKEFCMAESNKLDKMCHKCLQDKPCKFSSFPPKIAKYSDKQKDLSKNGVSLMQININFQRIKSDLFDNCEGTQQEKNLF